MADVHDRQRSRRNPAAVQVEDVAAVERLENEIGGGYLTQVFQESGRYLPPPKKQVKTKKHRKPEKPLARGAKLVGLAAAVGLLTASVVTAASLADHRRNQATEAPQDLPEITGAAALSGFAPKESSKTSETPATTSSPSVSTSETTRTDTSTSTTATAAAAPKTSTGDHKTVSSNPPVTMRSGVSRSENNADKVAAVKDFYNTMSNDPQRALLLLDPHLAGNHSGELLSSWKSMESIDVQDIYVQPDGSVHATVLIRQLDGTLLRISQLLKLADSGTARIDKAWLLSAERL